MTSWFEPTRDVHSYINAGVARRVDPTRTLTLRRAYEKEMRRRFRALLKAIIERLARDRLMPAPRQNQTYSRTYDIAKISAFLEWLKRAQSQGILGVEYGTPLTSAAQTQWQNLYLRAAYQSGVNNAASSLREAGATVEPTWLEASFSRPIHADRAGLIFTQGYMHLAGITEAMDAALSRTLAQGIVEGLGARELARNISRDVGMSLSRAQVFARTEVISVHAEATLNALQEAGVREVEPEVEFQTSRDAAVCLRCKALEGRRYSIEDARGVIPVHPNAVLEGSSFRSYGQLREMVRARYSGPAIRFRAGAEQVTIGPNHPVLTGRGWKRAYALCEGDHLVYDERAQSSVTAGGPSDFKQVPKVEDIFEALRLRGTRTVAAGAGLNLHGDGVFCQGEIEVISSIRELLDESDAAFLEHPSKLDFVRADARVSRKASAGDSLSHGEAVRRSTNGRMGRSNASEPSFGGRVASLEPIAFGDRPSHPFLRDDFPNGRSRASDEGNHGIARNTRDVKRDDSVARDWVRLVETDAGVLDLVGHWLTVPIEQVEWVHFEGWAYDAATESGIYLSDGFVVSNCRCNFKAVPAGLEGIVLR